MTKAKLILKSGKQDSIERQHPWIFSGAIKKVEGSPANGDLVDVYSNKDVFLGKGHYQEASIMVRILSFEDQEIDQAFFQRKIEKAYTMRKAIGLIDNSDTNVYRLVFAEGDGLPGLVVDIYGKTAVIQAHSYGMHRQRNQIAEAIKACYEDNIETIYYKGQENLSNSQEKEAVVNEFLLGDLHEDIVVEKGVEFKVNWVEGQKTGFFIDQRENRALVGKYAHGRSVLNTFCYTGGFSLYALKAGATQVDSVDSSAKAIDLTNENVKLNGFESNHQSFCMDTMKFLEENENEYDIIILDPPAYAKHKNVKHRAVQGYKRLNLTALRKIKSGGILFTFSCSQVIDARLFEATITSAAILAQRKIKILHHLSQPADHPYSIFHPEGRYLKGLILYVE